MIILTFYAVLLGQRAHDVEQLTPLVREFGYVRGLDHRPHVFSVTKTARSLIDSPAYPHDRAEGPMLRERVPRSERKHLIGVDAPGGAICVLLRQNESRDLLMR